MAQHNDGGKRPYLAYSKGAIEGDLKSRPEQMREPIEAIEAGAHDKGMNDMSREEVKARLEASEARVATAVEGMRADAAELRGDMAVALGRIQAQGDQMKADSSAFYADARTILAEIRLAQEQNRNTAYAIGYKVIVWAIGTVIALAGLAIGGYNALKKPSPVTPTSVSEPAKTVPSPTKQ